MTLATILISKFGTFIWTFLSGPLAEFLKKHWKEVICITALAWVIMCFLSHCTGIIDPWGNHSGSDTTSTVQVDTAWVYPDSAKVFALIWKQKEPYYTERIHDSLRRRFNRPAPPTFRPDYTCRDSLVAVIRSLEMLNITFDECDSAYYDAIAVRSYGDTMRTDSIEVAVNFRVEGRLRGTPTVNYRYLAPYPVITVTRKEIIEKGPYRKIYVEGGVGPDMTWGNTLSAIRGSLGAGYTDKRNWSYGVRSGFTQNGYTVEGSVRKSFDLGRKK